jgi:hypothetical protein
MKKNEHSGLTLSALLKAVLHAFSSLFLSENKDFQRLKNFIAS